jgi:hypothetical protein
MSGIFNFQGDVLCQVDIDEIKIIQEFKSIDEVCEKFKGNKNILIGSLRRGIGKCLKGNLKMCAGYTWGMKKEINEQGITSFVESKRSFYYSKIKKNNEILNCDNDKICQIDEISRKVVAEYDNIDEACKSQSLVNILRKREMIKNCISGQTRSVANFLWVKKSQINKTSIEAICEERKSKLGENIGKTKHDHLMAFENDVLCQIDVETEQIIHEYKNFEDVKVSMNEMSLNSKFKYAILECIRGLQKKCRGYSWVMKKELVKTGIDVFCKQKKILTNQQHLLSLMFPKFLKK